jgi:hypothetical protein
MHGGTRLAGQKGRQVAQVVEVLQQVEVVVHEAVVLVAEAESLPVAALQALESAPILHVAGLGLNGWRLHHAIRPAPPRARPRPLITTALRASAVSRCCRTGRSQERRPREECQVA